MVKVKLRVPLSSAPRETSSPLSNPLRSAPDYSDDEEPSTPQFQSAPASDGPDAGELEEDEELDDEDEDNDELDEQDELEDEDAPVASSSTPKRRSITLKSRTSDTGGGSASPSLEGSASPTLSGTGKHRRPNLARIAQVKAMTVEELDALPAAKRRKTAKARGAAGPGRGWRKGLTKGQKPVYELPPEERTPASFGNTANHPRSNTIVAVKGQTPTPTSAAAPRPKPAVAEAAKPVARAIAPSTAGISSAAAAIKIVSAGGQTFTGDLSAKAGTAKNPGFRYPPLPSSRAGPPVQPIARIPTAFQTGIALERNNRQPRRWVKGKREVLSMGGRPWSVPVFYGGEDRGYEKKVDAPAMPVAAAPAGGGGGGGEKVASKAGTPSAPAPASKASPTPTPTPTAGGAAKASPAATTAVGAAGSPLPPPKHLGALQAAATDWRGQSPAFLFGGRQ